MSSEIQEAPQKPVKRARGVDTAKAWIFGAVMTVTGALGVGGFSAVSAQEAPKEVVIADTAQTLYAPDLKASAEKTKFYRPITVVVFTTNGSQSESHQDFNGKILQYAQKNHPEWLSPDQQKWADGYYLISLDPQGRKVGTYAGEDIKLSSGKYEDIQKDAGKEFKNANWTEGVNVAVREGAEVLGRPWYASVGAMIGAAFLWLAGLIAGAIFFFTRRYYRAKAREALVRGDQHFSQVTMDLDATELHARALPSESRYANKILGLFERYQQDYRRLVKEKNKISALTSQDYSQAAGVKKAQKYEENARRLDQADDVIADTSKLLSKEAGWQKVWDQQTRPLIDEYSHLDEQLKKTGKVDDLPSAAALRSFALDELEKISRVSGDVHNGQIGIDDALDALRASREKFNELLETHQEAVVDVVCKNKDERKLMRKSFAQAKESDVQRRRDYEGTIYASAYSTPYWSVWAFSGGYSSGVSSVQSAQSSSSGSGYSGGGSFSGSGSSSSF